MLVNEIHKSILDAIDKRVKIFIRWAKFDRTLYGKVYSINGGNIGVLINDEIKDCRVKDGIDVIIDDVVIVKVPNNDENFMYVDGKLKRKVV